jgi:hypothetical protein
MDPVSSDIRVPATGDIDGVVVHVRKPGRTKRVRIVTAADFQPNAAGFARFQEMLFRSCITSATGLKHPESKEPMQLARVNHPVLGPIAISEVYDALPEGIMVPIGDALEVAVGRDGDLVVKN